MSAHGKRRPIVVTVTIADLDKAIADPSRCVLGHAMRRHRKRREIVSVGYPSRLKDTSRIGDSDYLHYSEIPVLFDDDKHADVYELLPCKVTFYPIEAGNIASRWESVTA